MFQRQGKIYKYCILVIITIFLCSCGGNEIRTEQKISNMLMLLGKGSLNLTIYYLNPSSLTLLPVGVDDLVNGGYEYKFSFDNDSLSEHIDLFQQLKTANLEPAKQQSLINARIYYIFANNSRNRFLGDLTRTKS